MGVMMKELIERLETLSGPDREVDHLIANAVYGKQSWWSPTVDWCRLYHARPTASLDAARTLVPEHSTIRMANCHEGIVGGHAWVATLKNPYMSFPEIFGEFCSTPDNRKSMAIALCIAALKAREAKTGDTP